MESVGKGSLMTQTLLSLLRVTGLHPVEWVLGLCFPRVAESLKRGCYPTP